MTIIPAGTKIACAWCGRALVCDGETAMCPHCQSIKSRGYSYAEASDAVARMQAEVEASEEE